MQPIDIIPFVLVLIILTMFQIINATPLGYQGTRDRGLCSGQRVYEVLGRKGGNVVNMVKTFNKKNARLN